jgi:hypothetical protein
MSASKRPSTSSLRRFITSRPFITIAELRRRFGLDDPNAMTLLSRNGTSAWIGLPEREASKLQELWSRGEVGIELSVEVRAPVVVGVFPMRIARYVVEGTNGNGSYPGGNGHGPANDNSAAAPSLRDEVPDPPSGRPNDHPHAPRQMFGAPSYSRGSERLRAPGDPGSG